MVLSSQCCFLRSRLWPAMRTNITLISEPDVPPFAGCDSSHAIQDKWPWGCSLKMAHFSRADPCSVDCGCKTPKFCLEFFVDLGVEFSLFFQRKRPKNSLKNPPPIHPEILEKFPSHFCRSFPVSRWKNRSSHGVEHQGFTNDQFN